LTYLHLPEGPSIQRVVTRSSSERNGDSELAVAHYCASRSSHAVCLPLEDVPCVLACFVVACSRLVVSSPPRGLRTRAPNPFIGSVTFLRLDPATEFNPDAARTRRAHALPRFCTPTTLPIHRGPPLPGFAFPGHVASLHLPCASTLYSLDELLGVFSTKCALGTTSPTELDLTEIVTVSRCDIPSCDWRT
jgi:hypothetical protein